MSGNPSKGPPPLSSPDVIGGPFMDTSPPISGPRELRRRKSRPFSHLRYEIDLATDAGNSVKHPWFSELKVVLERKNIDQGDEIVHRAAGVLHGMSARRFKWIDHWEVHPGGWLPLPGRKNRDEGEEPVGTLLAALDRDDCPPVSKAHELSVRLSDHQGDRADVIVRRSPHIGHHAITLDLFGKWTGDTAEDVIGSIHTRLPMAHAELTKYQYVVEKD